MISIGWAIIGCIAWSVAAFVIGIVLATGKRRDLEKANWALSHQVRRMQMILGVNERSIASLKRQLGRVKKQRDDATQDATLWREVALDEEDAKCTGP